MKKSNESREMYLKTIMTLEKSIPKVRNTDIAQALSYSKPSVTRAVRKLIEDGLIVNDKKTAFLLRHSEEKPRKDWYSGIMLSTISL